MTAGAGNWTQISRSQASTLNHWTIPDSIYSILHWNWPAHTFVWYQLPLYYCLAKCHAEECYVMLRIHFNCGSMYETYKTKQYIQRWMEDLCCSFFQASPPMAPDILLIILFRSLASYAWLKCFLCRITTNISYYQVVPNPFCRPTICGWISPQSIMHETWATGSTKGPDRRLEIRGSRWTNAAAKNHQLGFTSTIMLTTNITFNTDNQSQFSNTMGVALSFHDTSNSTSFSQIGRASCRERV